MTAIEAQEKLEAGEIVTHPVLGAAIMVINYHTLCKKNNITGPIVNTFSKMPTVMIDYSSTKEEMEANPMALMKVFDKKMFESHAFDWELIDPFIQKKIDEKLIDQFCPLGLGSMVSPN